MPVDDLGQIITIVRKTCRTLRTRVGSGCSGSIEVLRGVWQGEVELGDRGHFGAC